MVDVKKTRKVLFVATVVKMHIMEFHIPYLKMLKEMGWETSVAARNDYDNKASCIIPYCDNYYDIPFSRSPYSFHNITAYRELKRLISKEHYDVIHCHTPVGGALTRLAAKNFCKQGMKVLYTAHGFHFYSKAPLFNWIFYYPLEKYLSKYTDVLFTINCEDFNQVRNKFNARHIVHMPGIGVNTSKFNKSKDSLKTIRQELNIPPNATWLISVGELNKNKNHESVIKALAKINSQNLYYTIIGTGKLKERLSKLIVKYGLQEKISLAGYREDVYQFYSAADIFVFPSFREGLSLSLMEAMSSSLPVICSNIRGNNELIDSSGGILFDPYNNFDLENAIKELTAKTQSELHAMGIHNTQKVSNYDLCKTLTIVREVYIKISEGQW